jgi:hypothetical protein
MVETNDLVGVVGALVVVGGVGLIATVDPVAGAGAALLVVGLVAVVVVFVQKLLASMGMSLAQLF